MTILDTSNLHNAPAAAAPSASCSVDTMVYPSPYRHYEEDLVMVDGCGSDDSEERTPTFCDDENASFANDIVINLSVGKLNQSTRRETLFRSVLLQNILNDRVHEREVGVQCYGKMRMREVQFMVQRHRRLSGGLREQPRAWDDVDTDIMDLDGLMRSENDATQQRERHAHLSAACVVGRDGNMYSREECETYNDDFAFDGYPNTHDDNEDPGMMLDEDGTEDGESEGSSTEWTTDEDDDDTVSSSSTHETPDDATVPDAHAPHMRIKLVLSKPSSDCSSSSNKSLSLAEHRPRLKRRRSVGADVTNRSNDGGSKGGAMAQPAWCKRARFNSTQDWTSMRALSPVCSQS